MLKDYDSLPKILKDLNIWLCYDDRDKDFFINLSDAEINQERKAPRDLKGIKCSLNRCYSFKECIESIKNGINSGLGVVCNNNGLVVIDYDKCISSYEIDDKHGLRLPILNDKDKDRIQKDISLINSYTEISPSKKGIHIYLFANKSIKVNIKRDNIEIYTKHFIRVSGDLYNPYLYNEIEDKTDELEQLLNNYNINLKNDEIGNKSIIKQKIKNVYNDLLKQKIKYVNGFNIREIKDTMFNSKKGDLLKKLYYNTITDDDFYKLKGKKTASDEVKAKIDKSNSGKSITLIMHLLHFCYGDIESVYKIFKSSALCKNEYLIKKYSNHKEDKIQNQFIPYAIVQYCNYSNDREYYKTK